MEACIQTVAIEMRVEGESSDILKVQGMRNNELSDTEEREDKELLVPVRFSCPG